MNYLDPCRYEAVQSRRYQNYARNRNILKLRHNNGFNDWHDLCTNYLSSLSGNACPRYSCFCADRQIVRKRDKCRIISAIMY